MPRIESPTLMRHGMRGWGWALGLAFGAGIGPRQGLAVAPGWAYTQSEPTTTEDPLETLTLVSRVVRGVVRGGRQRGNSRPVPVQLFCRSFASGSGRFQAILIETRGISVGEKRLPCRGFPPDRPPFSVAKRVTGAASACHAGRRHQDPVVACASACPQRQQPQQWRRSQNATYGPRLRLARLSILESAPLYRP